mgnify:CR=1 FL=1
MVGSMREPVSRLSAQYQVSRRAFAQHIFGTTQMTPIDAGGPAAQNPADLPNDVLIVEDDTLMIDADLVLRVPQDMQASHAEVQRTHYRRAFTLSRELDPDKVSAEMSQGVLRLRIPKAEHAQPRRITVQVA